jgi:hypothetical protein
MDASTTLGRFGRRAASRPWPRWLVRTEAHRDWYACNRTPRPIWVERGSEVFTLAPLEERWFPRDPAGDFPLAPLIGRQQLEIVRRRRPASPDPAVGLAFRVWLVTAVVWLAFYWPLPTWWWLRSGGVLAIVLALHAVALLVRPAPNPARTAGGQADLTPVESRNLARVWWNDAMMLVVVLLGVAMPAAAVYFSTDLHEVVTVHPTSVRIDTERPQVLVARLAQLTFIAVATLLPGLMYFQFDVERMITLRSRWMQNVFRLDPTVSTVSDVEAKYGCQLDEAYGSLGGQRGRPARSHRSPIIVATVVLAFGWLIILLRAGSRIGSDGANGISFVDLLDPDPSLVTYAFLGAYFFGLQLIWQGYVRADLRPKTYTTVTVRVLVVVVLAWLIDATLGTVQPAHVLYLLAFVAGLVPNTVLHFLAEKVLRQLGGTFNRDKVQQLTVLDGIDLYERTRLSEEGITSVEALAHHDLLDLFFKTRIAAARLIDWMDQAILAMYLGPDRTGAGAPSAVDLRAGLRSVGIRTATDLVAVTGPATERPGRVDEVAAAVAAGINGCTAAQLAQRLRLIVDCLDRSEWLGRIDYWRTSDLVQVDPCERRYLDGNGELRVGDPRVAAAA